MVQFCCNVKRTSDLPLKKYSFTVEILAGEKKMKKLQWKKQDFVNSLWIISLRLPTPSESFMEAKGEFNDLALRKWKGL